jgi:hypothetical protein
MIEDGEIQVRNQPLSNAANFNLIEDDDLQRSNTISTTKLKNKKVAKEVEPEA